jgi:hypothetical protein
VAQAAIFTKHQGQFHPRFLICQFAHAKALDAAESWSIWEKTMFSRKMILKFCQKQQKCRLNSSDGISKTVLRLNVDTRRNRRLRIVRRQKRSGKLPAAAAAARYAQLRLQIAHCGRAGGDGFLDLMVGNGIADADKHFVLRVFSNYRTDSGFYYRMQI